MSAKKADPQLSEISKKLDTLIRLSALDLVRDTKTQKEQIALLSDAGFRPVEIAGILGTSRNTVDVTLHTIRKEREEKESKEETRPEESTMTAEVKSEPEVTESAEKT